MEAPGFFMGGGYFGAGGFSPENMVSEPQFVVDDLLEFPNDDALMADGFFTAVANSGDSVEPVGSCNSSSVSGGDPHFSRAVAHFDSDLCVPYEDMAELEWLSNFVEDSFSAGEDLRSLHVAAGGKQKSPESSCSGGFQPEKALPVKARSKRSRAAADWSTRLPQLAGDPKSAARSDSISGDWSTRLPHIAETAGHQAPARRRAGGDSDSGGRKCLHCATEKTPQWRTGPMGPKTLCNACGVRFKSGRLVPEYRPAASPTFVSARHSNSHRKVLELRRQRDAHAQQHQQFMSQSSVFAASNGADEYLIHHRGHLHGPDYGHMI